MGTFVNNYHGVAMTTTNEAWADEIRIMQEVLQPWKDEDGQVIFEYDSESESMLFCCFVGLSSASSSRLDKRLRRRICSHISSKY